MATAIQITEENCPMPIDNDEGVLSDGALPYNPRNEDQRPTQPTAYGRIIVIQPSGDENVRKQFVSQSLKLAKLLQTSEFSKAKIINVRTNFLKCKVSVKIENENMIEKLLQIEKLGNYKVKCEQPPSHAEICGVTQSYTV